MHGSRSQSGKSCHGDVCAYVMPDPRAAVAYLHVSNSAALLRQPPITTAKETTTARATERRATDCKGDIETFLVRPPKRRKEKAIVWLKYLFMALAPPVNRGFASSRFQPPKGALKRRFGNHYGPLKSREYRGGVTKWIGGFLLQFNKERDLC